MVSKSDIAIGLLIVLILAGIYLSLPDRPTFSISIFNFDAGSHEVSLIASDLNNNEILNRTEFLAPGENKLYEEITKKKGTYLVNVTIDGNTTIEKADFNEEKTLMIDITSDGIEFGYAMP